MRILFAIFIVLFSSPVLAGDYMLYVSNEYDSPCTERPRKIHWWCEQQRNEGKKCISELSWPIKTGAEVSESLIQYFNGDAPNIGILKSAFANGHLNFCGTTEIETVYDTLIGLRKVGVKKHEAHLDDFIGKIEKLR